MCLLSFYFQSEVSYGTYQNNSSQSFAEVLLKIGKLAETRGEGKDLIPTTEGMDILYIFTSVFTTYSEYRNICGWV